MIDERDAVDDYRSYILRIAFRFVQPKTRMPQSLWKFMEFLRKSGLPFDVLNTRLPSGGRNARSRLRRLCKMPRMSTYAIGAMINHGISQMAPTVTFVNVGVWHGFSLLAGMINNPGKKCIGIDNFSEFGGPRESFLQRFRESRSENHHFYEMDYREYFTRVHKGSIGFYMYDGEHSYENQLRGLEIAEPFFGNNCIILVDDTNWEAPRLATRDFISRSSKNYRVLLEETTDCNCHPTLWNGVMVLRKVD